VREDPDDAALVLEFLAWMHASKADFTNTFRALAEDSLAPDASRAAWDARWRARVSKEAVQGHEHDLVRVRMRGGSPAIIPRNHCVEEALAAAEHGDFTHFELLLAALQRPWNPLPSDARFRQPAPAECCGYRTFCGT
jgi:uncharacterized protein YdiU (UPF0061 family)